MKAIKIRHRDIEGFNKRINLVCPEEIEETAKFILRKEYSMPLDSLIIQTAKVLGFNRLSDETYSHIKRRVYALLKKGSISKKDDRLTLVK